MTQNAQQLHDAAPIAHARAAQTHAPLGAARPAKRLSEEGQQRIWILGSATKWCRKVVTTEVNIPTVMLWLWDGGKKLPRAPSFPDP